MTISYGVIGGVSLLLWFLTPWSPSELLIPWSRKEKVILVLAFICVGLILLLIAVVDGARRLHEGAVIRLKERHSSELITLNTQRVSDLHDSNKRVLIAGTLSRCVAMIEEHVTALQQLRQSSLDQGFFEPWLNSVEYSIKDLLGPDAVNEFYGPDTGKGKLPPDDINEQVLWMRKYTAKLNMIIDGQLHPLNPDPQSDAAGDK